MFCWGFHWWLTQSGMNCWWLQQLGISQSHNKSISTILSYIALHSFGLSHFLYICHCKDFSTKSQSCDFLGAILCFISWTKADLQDASSVLSPSTDAKCPCRGERETAACPLTQAAGCRGEQQGWTEMRRLLTGVTFGLPTCLPTSAYYSSATPSNLPPSHWFGCCMMDGAQTRS